MDDLHVIIMSLDILEEREYGLLSFVGYSQDIPCIMVGDEKMGAKLVAEKTPKIR